MWHVEMVDSVNGAHMDLSEDSCVTHWERRISQKEITVAGLAPMCYSFSRGLRPAVREGPLQHLWGLPTERLPARIRGTTGALYLQRANSEVRSFLRLTWSLATSGTDFWVEQPAVQSLQLMPVTGEPNPFYQRAATRQASLFLMPEWIEIERFTGGWYIALKQCPFGATSVKPTWVFGTPRLARSMGHLRWAACHCPFHMKLRGWAPSGRSWTSLSQAYPGPLNAQLAWSMDTCWPAEMQRPDWNTDAVTQSAAELPVHLDDLSDDDSMPNLCDMSDDDMSEQSEPPDDMSDDNSIPCLPPPLLRVERHSREHSPPRCVPRRPRRL